MNQNTANGKFYVYQDGACCNSRPDVASSVALAEVLLNNGVHGVKTTFTVYSPNAEIVASITNRRIEGTFLKQSWGGHKNDTAIDCGRVAFDATAAILLLPHAELVELKDNCESSDAIGQAHVEWSGPFEVSIVDSVCQYFGVDDIREITVESFEFARQRENPQAAIEAVVTLSIKVNLRMLPGTDIADFVENLDYSVVSKTPGIIATKTEIIASN